MAAREREKELDAIAINEQHLGSKKPRRRSIPKPWRCSASRLTRTTLRAPAATTPSTSSHTRASSQLLFGRGFLAGIDRHDQKKKAATKLKVKRRDARALLTRTIMQLTRTLRIMICMRHSICV
jgi:ATP-dependent RNA helicase DDX23/PRP28